LTHLRENWFAETLHGSYEQRLEITNILYHSKSELQDVMIFETPFFGRVLALDGIIQTTQRDEACYHEMLVHVPVFTHGDIKDVLIIGGGDGGALRETLRHPEVKNVTLVEIDESVVKVCQEYLPSLSGGAFNDPRCSLVISDGLQFVTKTKQKFDLIIVDSSDPVGPSEPLFSRKFYRDCHSLLSNDGIFICQSGVSFVQEEEARTTLQRLDSVFKDATLYVTQVPTYSFGFMTLGWGAKNPALRATKNKEIRARFRKANLQMKYYTTDIHQASFVLPEYMHY